MLPHRGDPREGSRRRSGSAASRSCCRGGLHPDFKLDWYERMLSRHQGTEFPQVNVHGFSPPEIHHFTKVNKLPLGDGPRSPASDAGLGSLPGGGAEILVDRVRKEITRGKVLTDDWLERHEGVAPAGRPLQRDDDVRSRRDTRGAQSSTWNGVRQLQDESLRGRPRRLHGFHLLDVSAGQHSRWTTWQPAWRARVPASMQRRRASLPR